MSFSECINILCNKYDVTISVLINYLSVYKQPKQYSKLLRSEDVLVINKTMFNTRVTVIKYIK